MTRICRICQARADTPGYVFQERMFGWGDRFDYFQCQACGALQISQVPSDLARFYPPTYYSFHLQPLPQTGLKSRLAGWRDRASATRRGIVGKWLAQVIAPRVDVVALGDVPARREMRILDVGCGRGQLLSALHRAGFRRLIGVDPFLPNDVEVLPGLKVFRQSVADRTDRFDLIMLHHVFEHLEDGGEMLRQCRERLAPGGRILIRIPTVDGDLWPRYREFWVALDAPRHLILHSRASLTHVAQQSGLSLAQWRYDSTGFALYASELYRKGQPLVQPDGRPTNEQDHFSPGQLQAYEAEAQALNNAGRGDQVVAILREAGGQ